jgi:hypothetical protein
MNASNARAFALARRPVGKTAHRSIDGGVHSCSTARTTPRSSSDANIHCDAIASPRSASTTSRTPSAAVMRSRPSATTDVSVLPFVHVHAVPPPSLQPRKRVQFAEIVGGDELHRLDKLA